MGANETQSADILKAVGTVIAIFLLIAAAAFVVELICVVLVKVSGNGHGTDLPEVIKLSLWPMIFTRLAGIVAAILAIQAIREYRMPGRVTGGALAGFIGTSLAFYTLPLLTTGNLIVGMVMGAVVCACMGKSGRQAGVRGTPGARGRA